MAFFGIFRDWGSGKCYNFNHMKIRIKDNSVRLRLQRSEVAIFRETGRVQKQTVFPGSELKYMLVGSSGHQQLAAEFSNNSITVFVPEAMAEKWTATDEIGMEHNMELPNGDKLFLLVEKDFQCLDHTREDQSDMYINPSKTC